MKIICSEVPKPSYPLYFDQVSESTQPLRMRQILGFATQPRCSSNFFCKQEHIVLERSARFEI